ncbi:hypothetical protein K501DRAFT_268284 [Backusella circina FSU 941]|nr:hypothetical protein K501DRAFT_268284 [Backusella circina FSU 941]
MVNQENFYSLKYICHSFTTFRSVFAYEQHWGAEHVGLPLNSSDKIPNSMDMNAASGHAFENESSNTWYESLASLIQEELIEAQNSNEPYNIATTSLNEIKRRLQQEASGDIKLSYQSFYNEKNLLRRCSALPSTVRFDSYTIISIHRIYTIFDMVISLKQKLLLDKICQNR